MRRFFQRLGYAESIALATAIILLMQLWVIWRQMEISEKVGELSERLAALQEAESLPQLAVIISKTQLVVADDQHNLMIDYDIKNYGGTPTLDCRLSWFCGKRGELEVKNMFEVQKSGVANPVFPGGDLSSSVLHPFGRRLSPSVDSGRTEYIRFATSYTDPIGQSHHCVFDYSVKLFPIIDEKGAPAWQIARASERAHCRTLARGEEIQDQPWYTDKDATFWP